MVDRLDLWSQNPLRPLDASLPYELSFLNTQATATDSTLQIVHLHDICEMYGLRSSARGIIREFIELAEHHKKH